MERKEIELLQARCTRFLAYHYRQTVQQALLELAETVSPDLKPDMYGQGELIEGFESEVASLLGKEKAVFMPSGTMAQQIALRIWAERRHSLYVAFHPTCHLEIHEQKGYQLLHGLHGILAGSRDRLIGLEDLKQISAPLAALLLELPQREIGGQLPSWEGLVDQAEWAHSRGAALHLDGARLWECQPYYGRSYAEIAALFDSVYVSFYKGLGGTAGAILAGPADFIAEARPWLRRHGGNLIRLYPYVLSARHGLALRLERMPAYHQKAVEVAAALSGLPEVEIVPDPPHTNMMHLYLRGDAARLEAAALELAAETGVWLFGSLAPSPLPHYQKLELSVGDATLDIPTPEIADLFQALFERAGEK